MPFWQTYYHLVWTTRDREPLIRPEIEGRLFAYIVRKAAELGAYVYAINGWHDHLHLVVSIPPKLAVARLVAHLKGASTHDLNHEARLDYEFAWQRGYGVLTLGMRQKPVAVEYVNNQKRHHQEQTAIPWLERDSEVDDGPNDRGLKASPVPAVIEEEGVAYETSGMSPF